MKIIKVLVLLFVCVGFNVTAQTVVEPENCVLNSIGKGNQTSAIDVNTLGVIRHNCIKIYIRSIENKSVSINQSLVSQLTLHWFPRLQTLGPPYYINESIRINVKNNSLYKLIYIVVVITNKETQVSETYKLYADNIIDPFSVGSFSGSVITNDIYNMEGFTSKYMWGMVSLYGFSK